MSTGAPAPASPAGPRRRPALVRPTVIYLISRLVTGAALAVAAITTHVSFATAVDRWDSRWFLRAAATGWPQHLVTVHGRVTGTTIAFFPVFPLAIRVLAHLSGAPLLVTGAALSSLTGLSAVVAVWFLVRQYGDHGRPTAPLCCWPCFPAPSSSA